MIKQENFNYISLTKFATKINVSSKTIKRYINEIEEKENIKINYPGRRGINLSYYSNQSRDLSGRFSYKDESTYIKYSDKTGKPEINKKSNDFISKAQTFKESLDQKLVVQSKAVSKQKKIKSDEDYLRQIKDLD